jgi:hypothetical protein
MHGVCFVFRARSVAVMRGEGGRVGGCGRHWHDCRSVCMPNVHTHLLATVWLAIREFQCILGTISTMLGSIASVVMGSLRTEQSGSCVYHVLNGAQPSAVEKLLRGRSGSRAALIMPRYQPGYIAMVSRPQVTAITADQTWIQPQLHRHGIIPLLHLTRISSQQLNPPC